MAIEVAVIPAAGRGTRMRPITRAVPKSLVPVVDRPAVQWVVEEAVRGGAREVFIVVDADSQELVERHFNSAEEEPLPGLEDVNIQTLIQPVARGLGHAVAVAEEAVGGRPFTCLLVDNLAVPGEDVLSDMTAARNGGSVVCVRDLPESFLDRYGFVAPRESISDTVLEISGAIEKPGIKDAPSKLGLVGRYLFSAEIFDALRDTAPSVGGEIQLTDAIDRVASQGLCRAFITEFELLDVGIPESYLQALTKLAVAHPEYGNRNADIISESLGDNR
jgi:UTP--glucose-1-phosphate uridylyltransferase